MLLLSFSDLIELLLINIDEIFAGKKFGRELINKIGLNYIVIYLYNIYIYIYI